jgi:anti-sigma factor RsiW
VDCDELRPLLPGYADGELDLIHILQVERHLGDCPACSEELQRQQALRQALRDPALYHRAPPGLAERVRSALPRPVRPRAWRTSRWRWAALAAAVAVAVLLPWGVVRLAALSSAADQKAEEVVACHIRSLMAEHLLDIASSNRHVVKPWFAGKVDFAPPVQDLKEDGYPLRGGRLDYLGGRKAAALVYERHGHVINVFVQPAPGAEAPRGLERQGYHLFRWSEGGLSFWVVSDLNEQELRDLVGLLRRP